MVIRYQDRNGYSLMELVIAMVLVSIVISNVYFFWRYMDKHVLVHSENASLQRNRPIDSSDYHFCSQSLLRVALRPEIDHFSGEADEDTISYSFSEDTLYKNKVPLTILARKAHVKNFEIKNLNDDPYHASVSILLEFNLTLSNPSGYESEAKLVVKTRRPVHQLDPTFGW